MIDTPSLVDQYCHGVLRTELGLGTFETHLAPAPPMTRSAHRRTPPPLPAAGTTFFDTQTGFAVRRWCPPLLGLEPHCPPAHYLGEWVGDGAWSRTDARRVAAMRAAGNARRVYRLVRTAARTAARTGGPDGRPGALSVAAGSFGSKRMDHGGGGKPCGT